MHVVAVATPGVAAREINEMDGNVILNGGPNDAGVGRVVILVGAKDENRFRQRIDRDLELVSRDGCASSVVDRYFYRVVSGWQRVEHCLTAAADFSADGQVDDLLTAGVHQTHRHGRAIPLCARRLLHREPNCWLHSRWKHRVGRVEADDVRYKLWWVEMPVRLRFRNLIETRVEVQKRILLGKRSIRRSRKCWQRERQIVNMIRLLTIADYDGVIVQHRLLLCLHDC